MAKKSIEIRNSDMSDEMQREALQVALLAVNMYTKGNDIANYIVKEFERKYGGIWHCIMGSSGYSVQNKPNSFIRFSVGDKRITLFRSA